MDAHGRRLENLQRILDHAHKNKWTIDTEDVRTKLMQSCGSFALEPTTLKGYVATIMRSLSWEKQTGKKAVFKNGGLLE